MKLNSDHLLRICLLSVLLAKTLYLPVCFAEEMPPPSLQDMQIAGRVLKFQQERAGTDIVVAIVYSATDARSHVEATMIAGLLGSGLSVGDLVLRPALVEQANLKDMSGYGAVFATAGINETLLRAGLQQREMPCLTRHIEQVANGACIVALRSTPTVSIYFSGANAAAARVSFANAFVMMVREI